MSLTRRLAAGLPAAGVTVLAALALTGSPAAATGDESAARAKPAVMSTPCSAVPRGTKCDYADDTPAGNAAATPDDSTPGGAAPTSGGYGPTPGGAGPTSGGYRPTPGGNGATPDDNGAGPTRGNAGYGGEDVLRGVSIEVARGTIVAIIGPNGSGKSTLLKVIYGLVRAREGQLTLTDREGKERDLTALRTNEITAHGVNMVPQLANVFPEMSVLENLEIGALPIKHRFAKQLEAVLAALPPDQ